MLLPVLTIVGRPNVGKSTLYNRLTKTRDAIVGDESGITRDRHYGEAFFLGRHFIVVDTGGIAEPDDPEMGAMTAQQVDTALEEANVVLFVVDSKAGIVNADRDIARKLRSLTDKKIIVIANKADNDVAQSIAAEFYQLGLKEVLALSAGSGRGVPLLQERLCADFPENSLAEKSEIRTKIAIVGRPNVGKSTLVNRILGEERVIVFDRPGTTRDSIQIPFERRDKAYSLIDTAGIRRQKSISEGIEIFSVIKAMQAMKQADVIVAVLDAREGVAEQDRRLLGLALQTGNAMVLAFNKWDGMSIEAREHFKNEVDRTLPFLKFARRYYVSAKHGTGTGRLLDAVDETQQSLAQEFPTHALTEILMQATQAHQPPLVSGRRVKLRFAHLGARKPLTIVIHGKQVDKLPNAYRQYLVYSFCEALGLSGLPLILKFLTDKNPYV